MTETPHLGTKQYSVTQNSTTPVLGSYAPLCVAGQPPSGVHGCRLHVASQARQPSTGADSIRRQSPFLNSSNSSNS